MTAYDMLISDWSSDVCSSDLGGMAWAVSYRPRLRFRWGKLRRLFGYSFGNLGADLANFITFQRPLIVVTRQLGVATGGGYSLAARLSDIPTQVILVGLMNVLFPTFSSIADDAERHRKALLEIGSASCRERVGQYV